MSASRKPPAWAYEAREPEEGPPPPLPHPVNDADPGDLDGFAVNEDGIALAFAEKHAARLRYCHDTGAWFVWDGNSWRRDGKQLAFSWCRDLCRQMAVAVEKHGTKDVLAKAATAGAVERFARSDTRLARTREIWDADPWLLGTPGGTVDLRTGWLRRAMPHEHITKLAGATPAATEDCPRWLQFLEEVTGGDAELVRFLRNWCGYCLTGLTREEALLFIHGHGGNGKSKFLAVLQAILADYHATADMSAFTASKQDRHTTDLAMLAGARMVTASETSQGRAWDERRINSVTGGDPITARFMRKDNFTFRPEFKLTVVGNHKPVLRNVNDAAKRRFNIVPFNFKPKMRDEGLEEKLLAELPGILRWAINGCLNWQKNGLQRPDVVTKATEVYFSDQDMIAQWLAERCETTNSLEKGAASSALFRDWEAWAKARGEGSGSNKALSEDLEGRGFVKKSTNTGMVFLGLKLKPSETGVC